MKMKMVLFSLAVLLASVTRAFADPDPNFYIYLCFGQSNMEGGGRIEEQDRLVDHRFQVLADFDVPSRGWMRGQWYTAVPPLTRRTRGISLVDYFGRTMVANLPKNIRVGVVKVGVSGAKIKLWDKDSYREYLATADSWKVKIADEYGGNPYAYLVELAKIAQQSGVIKGILLHQGESDVEYEDWPKKVKVIYDNLMKDLNLKPDAVPLLAGEVVNNNQGGEKASANEIIKRLPETLSNSYVISSAGLPCNADHLHFTAEGYRLFGKRYAEKMLSILGYEVNETKLPATSIGALSAQANADWTEPFPPFKIAGNLYYVGSKGLANYLITTPQGHILINSDLKENVPLIRASVERLGFKFTDIKILLISHAHWDHNAASDTIKKLTGAKYLVMDADVPVIESGGKADFQYGNVPTSLYTPTKVDSVLRDGDEVRLGETVLVAHLTPGHTKGCTTWTMKVQDGNNTYNVVIIGSPNVNDGYRLVNNTAYPQIAADYEKMSRVLKALPCDIFLGAHGNYFDLETKYARLKENGSAVFVDPEGYKKYVADKEEAFKTELAKQRAARRNDERDDDRCRMISDGSWIVTLEDGTVKIYRTKNGAIIQHATGAYSLETDWDELINREDLARYLRDLLDTSGLPLVGGDFDQEILPPIVSQEVWAAGVTYYRSRTARIEESQTAGGGDFYDRVYMAERPELFFKATAHRVSGSGGAVRIRRDSHWNVPEPELALVVARRGKIVGYTIGNDMSSRDIEGANPLYLPQAKVYDRSCALGPCVLVAEEMLPAATEIKLRIERAGETVFAGETSLAQLKRTPESLVEFLFRDNSFPQGCFLLTGTGIVPPDDFTLQPGDEISITIEPIGTLVNVVE